MKSNLALSTINVEPDVKILFDKEYYLKRSENKDIKTQSQFVKYLLMTSRGIK